VTHQPDAMTHLQLSDRPWLSCTPCRSSCSEVSPCECCRARAAHLAPGEQGDSVPALLMPGEEITTAERAEQMGLNVEAQRLREPEVRHVSDGDAGVAGEA
jgi:hypothetical protein